MVARSWQAKRPEPSHHGSAWASPRAGGLRDAGRTGSQEENLSMANLRCGARAAASDQGDRRRPSNTCATLVAASRLMSATEVTQTELESRMRVNSRVRFTGRRR